MNKPLSKPRQSSDLTIDGRYPFTTDEIANTVTHTLGFMLSLVALWVFWRATQDNAWGLRLTCVVFTLSMAAVYFFSTLSHAVLEPHRRNRLRAWDQGTIYLLIAGTYSPFIWQCSPPGWTATIMVLVWGAAVWGFYLKVIAAYRVNAVSTVTYVLLGWLPTLPLVPQVPLICILWMLLGGLSYTLGIIFLMHRNQAWYTHSIWHIMVMLGSFFHCISIYQLLGFAPRMAQ
ncbi:MAG: hemolysin III family protein [Planctomycetales bacterium]|nr:hemolysin III family protein [Planctomycetales bacterium]